MTKNRAHKKAARERAALTGERYVVAERALAEPGVSAPAVAELAAPAVAAPLPTTRRRHQGPANRQHREPRVLVAWQHWIARRLGVSLTPAGR